MDFKGTIAIRHAHLTVNHVSAMVIQMYASRASKINGAPTVKTRAILTAPKPSKEASR